MPIYEQRLLQPMSASRCGWCHAHSWRLLWQVLLTNCIYYSEILVFILLLDVKVLISARHNDQNIPTTADLFHVELWQMFGRLQ